MSNKRKTNLFLAMIGFILIISLLAILSGRGFENINALHNKKELSTTSTANNTEDNAVLNLQITTGSVQSRIIAYSVAPFNVYPRNQTINNITVPINGSTISNGEIVVISGSITINGDKSYFNNLDTTVLNKIDTSDMRASEIICLEETMGSFVATFNTVLDNSFSLRDYLTYHNIYPYAVQLSKCQKYHEK